MQYEVLYMNDNGTAKVRMTIGNRALEQDFPCDDLDSHVKAGMAVFKSEIDRIVPPSRDNDLVGLINEVDALPEIPPEDLQPEQPTEE